MAKKDGRRVEATKEALSEALLDMLEKVPLRQIRVQELCRRAGINRTTFYNHYGSPEDLLEEIGEGFLEDISVRLSPADPCRPESVTEQTAAVLGYLEEHPALSRLLLNNTALLSLGEKLLALPKITDLLQASMAGCTDPVMREAVILFALEGSRRLLQDWLTREDRLPPREEAALILEVAGRVCR